MSTFTKKVASAVSIVALSATALSASVSSAASEFLPYAELLAGKDVINTSSEAGYRLNDGITRGELAKVAANLGGYKSAACDSKLFTDVNSSLGDLCDGITTLANAGVVSTSYTQFRPNDAVTRAEMVKIILGALGETGSNKSAGFTDVTASMGDLYGFVNRANELGCARTATYFRPNASSSRGETFKIASCAAKIKPNTGTTTPTNTGTTTPTNTGTTTPTTPAATSGLNVSIKKTPVAQYVPKNASSVNVGTITLAATDKDVTVKTVTVARAGLGNSDGVTIALGQNGATVSNDQRISSSTDTAIVRLSNALTLKKGESATFNVLVSIEDDTANAQNNQHQFTVKAIGTTDESTTVNGLPLTLGLINTTSYSVSKITVDKLDFETTLDSGESNQKLGTVEFSAGDRDLTLKGFTLSQGKGNLDFDEAFTNLKALYKGKEVGTVSVTDDTLVVTGLNVAIEEGDDEEIELRADIIYVGEEEKFTFEFDKTEDVSATEDSTGYTTYVTLDDEESDEITLKALKLNWTDETTKSETVAPDASNVTLFDAKLTASTNFEVTEFTVAFNDGTNYSQSPTDFSKLKLVVDGTTYDLLDETISSGKYTFDSSSDKFYVNAGSKVAVKITGTLKDSVSAGTKYKMTVDIKEVKNTSTGDSATPNDADSKGPTITVKKPTLVVDDATKSAPDADTIYADAEDFEIGRFSLKAEAEDVTVNQIKVTNGGSFTASGTTITDLSEIFDEDDVKLVDLSNGSTVSSDATISGNALTFKNISKTISQDSTVNFAIIADISDLETDNHGKITAGTLQFTLAKADVDTNDNGDAIDGDNVTMEKYTIGFIPPVVTLEKESTNVFVITFKNEDSDDYIEISKIRAQIKVDSDNDNAVLGTFCLREQGSDDTCSDAGTASGVSTNTGSIPSSTPTILSLATADRIKVSSNSTKKYEIYVQSAYNDLSSLTAEISKVTYTPENGTETTASYDVTAK